MKKYFLIICIAFTPVSIQAQWSLGGKAGINWSTINYPRSKLGDHADYLFSHLFQQAKISSKKSREEKITLFINRASNSYMYVQKGNPAMTIVSNRRIQFLPTPLYRYQNHTDSSRPRNTHLPPQEKHRY